MISYLGSLVQFSPAAGRAGRCRQMLLCVGSTRRVLARQPAVLAPSRRVPRAFSLRGERPGQPGVCASSPRVRRAFSLHGERPGQPEVCAASPWVRCAFYLRSVLPGKPEVWRPLHGRPAPFPSTALARRRSGLRKSLDRNRGLFAGWEGVASLGPSLPLAPHPASFLQRGWGCSSLEFLSPFVLQTTGGVFRRLIFPCSPTV